MAWLKEISQVVQGEAHDSENVHDDAEEAQGPEERGGVACDRLHHFHQLGRLGHEVDHQEREEPLLIRGAQHGNQKQENQPAWPTKRTTENSEIICRVRYSFPETSCCGKSDMVQIV